MFNQFYLLGPRGDSIIYRNFRYEISKSTAELFFRHVRFWNGKSQEAPPIFNVDGLHFVWAKRNGLYFVLTTVDNVSPTLATELLVRITKLFKDYCGVLTEEAIRLNFTLVYELLDEIIDFGYPQSTTNDSLKSFVHNEPVVVSSNSKFNPIRINVGTIGNIFSSSKTTASSAVEKPIGLNTKHSNDVYVDIYERIVMTFDASNNILNHSIDGTIQMKSYLSGNPELALGLNEDLIINDTGNASCVIADANFHECVNTDDLENARVLRLRPREGEFTLMNYRMDSDFKPPFRIFPYFEQVSPHKADLIVKIRCDIPSVAHANQIGITIPVPQCVTSVSCETSSIGNSVDQQCEFDNISKTLKWRIPKLHGNNEITLRCQIAINGNTNTNLRKMFGPIAMAFEIPTYSSSNLQVKYLRLANSSAAPPNRWVRYVTRSASYICRF